MADLADMPTLGEFQRNADDYVKRMKENNSPLILTVDGRADLVLQDAKSYQQMVDRLERADTVAAVRKAMEEYERGEGRPAREVVEEFRQKHGLPR